VFECIGVCAPLLCCTLPYCLAVCLLWPTTFVCVLMCWLAGAGAFFCFFEAPFPWIFGGFSSRFVCAFSALDCVCVCVLWLLGPYVHHFTHGTALCAHGLHCCRATSFCGLPFGGGGHTHTNVGPLCDVSHCNLQGFHLPTSALSLGTGDGEKQRIHVPHQLCDCYWCVVVLKSMLAIVSAALPPDECVGGSVPESVAAIVLS